MADDTDAKDTNEVSTLTDFVVRTLMDITNAIEAFEAVAPEGVTVRPQLRGATPSPSVAVSDDGSAVVFVDFDVATTSEVTRGLDGKVGLALDDVEEGNSPANAGEFSPFPQTPRVPAEALRARLESRKRSS